MPVKAKELGALAVSRIAVSKKRGLHAVGGVDGLLLQVTETGATSWLLRVMIAGKRRGMGLGAYPGVGVAAAREKARAARVLIEQGIDPIEQRHKVRQEAAVARANYKTFDECAQAMLAVKGAGWKNDKHRAQWSSTLQSYASPVLGKMSVRDIEMGDVLRVLSPIWNEKTETASRLRGRIEKVLDYATAHKYRQGLNPLDGKATSTRCWISPVKFPRSSTIPRWQSTMFGRSCCACVRLKAWEPGRWS